jgi:hypothetical protein
MCVSPKPQRSMACSGDSPFAASLIQSSSSFRFGFSCMPELLPSVLVDFKHSVAWSVSFEPASFKSSINFSIKTKCKLFWHFSSACRNSSTMSSEKTRPLGDSSEEGPVSGCAMQNNESSLSIAARKLLIARLGPHLQPMHRPRQPVSESLQPHLRACQRSYAKAIPPASVNAGERRTWSPHTVPPQFPRDSNPVRIPPIN